MNKLPQNVYFRATFLIDIKLIDSRDHFVHLYIKLKAMTENDRERHSNKHQYTKISALSAEHY